MGKNSNSYVNIFIFGVICLFLFSCGKKEEIIQESISDIPIEINNQLLSGDYQNAKSILKSKIESGKVLLSEKLDYIRANIGIATKSGDISLLGESKKMIEEILSSNPDSSEAYSLLGEIQMQEGNYELAEETLKKSLDINSNNIESIIRLGKLEQFKKNFKKSEQYLSQALKLLPDTDMVYFIMGENKFLQKDYNSAKKYFEATIRSTQNKMIAMQSYNNLAMIHLQSKKYDQAIKMLEVAILFDEENYLFHSNLGKIYLEQFKSELLENNNLDNKISNKIISELTRSIQLNPQHTISYILLGDTYELLGSKDYKTYYKKALELIDSDKKLKVEERTKIKELLNKKL